jgi:flagellar basal-body rod protein FlgB
MRTSLDSYLGIHPQALSLEAQRNELLAANLANVDTPNYKARDIDFKSALAAASGSVASGSVAGGTTASATGNAATPSSTLSLTASTSATQPQAGTVGSVDAVGGSIAPSALKYRVPMAPSLDGNSVDEQLEQSAFAENSVRYQATLTFLNSALRDLMTAITGS